jgi:predicted DsbA family dithiol-disulfide isomerase
MFAQVAAVAAGEGLEYDFDSLVVANSLRARELLHLAKERGVADAVKETLLSPHFEHGEDIGSVDLLERVGVEAGLEAAEVRNALTSGEYAAAVQADIQQARALGIQGVPFFVIDNRYGVSGAQPTELFSQALAQGWAERHPLAMVPSMTAEGAACGPDGCAI